MKRDEDRKRRLLNKKLLKTSSLYQNFDFHQNRQSLKEFSICFIYFCARNKLFPKLSLMIVWSFMGKWEEILTKRINKLIKLWEKSTSATEFRS